MLRNFSFACLPLVHISLSSRPNPPLRFSVLPTVGRDKCSHCLPPRTPLPHYDPPYAKAPPFEIELYPSVPGLPFIEDSPPMLASASATLHGLSLILLKLLVTLFRLPLRAQKGRGTAPLHHRRACAHPSLPLSLPPCIAQRGRASPPPLPLSLSLA